MMKKNAIMIDNYDVGDTLIKNKKAETVTNH